MLIDAIPYAVPLAGGLLALLFTPAVDRWVERFDAWVEGKYHLHRP